MSRLADNEKMRRECLRRARTHDPMTRRFLWSLLNHRDALLAELDALRAERDNFDEVLDAIWQYGADSLSGSVTEVDRGDYYRDAVREMTKRARIRKWPLPPTEGVSDAST